MTGSMLTVAANTEVSCTIANDDQPATLTLTKFVINDNGGTRSSADWQLTAGAQTFVSGISQAVGAGTYLLGESGPGGYAPGGWSCTGSGSLTGSTLTLAPGQVASCSITNDDIAPGNATISQLGPGTGSVGPLMLTATLRDTATGQRLAGRTLIFTLGSQTTAAPTDLSGIANAPLNLAQAPGRLTLTVTFAGDGVYAPTQASRSFEVVIDTDGDGLPDSWEINGVDLTGDGTIDLPLPAMGANPLRKDIFVEVDWMVKPEACVWLVCWSNGGVLQPQRAVLDALVARFAAAPVVNPDGSTGISLHVDGGPNTIMNPAQITGMFDAVMPSWAAEVHVAGRVAFDAVYRIEEPVIPRNPGRITVQSLQGEALCVLQIVRAGKAASGTVQLQQPTGELFEARISGKWNESTRTFEGVWLDDKAKGGSISFRLREP